MIEQDEASTLTELLDKQDDLLQAINKLAKAMKPPVITVEAPHVHVPPPSVVVEARPPCSYEVSDVERDSEGRIVSFMVRAIK